MSRVLGTQNGPGPESEDKERKNLRPYGLIFQGHSNDVQDSPRSSPDNQLMGTRSYNSPH